MKRKKNPFTFLFTLTCFIFFGCTEESVFTLKNIFPWLNSKEIESKKTPFEKQLASLANIKIINISRQGNKLRFELLFKQSLDHENPNTESFDQRLIFFYSGKTDAVTEIVTEGYSLDNIEETTYLSEKLDVNLLFVEFRYYGNSIPKSNKSNPFKFLNNTQQMHDYHKIRLELGEVLTGKWVSYGISKGALNALNYKQLYPDDVDLTMAIVAPINTEYENSKISDFIKNKVASKELREFVKQFQRIALEQRKIILPLFKSWAKDNNLTFNTVGGLPKAYEHAVIHFPLLYWQYEQYKEDFYSNSLVRNSENNPLSIFKRLAESSAFYFISDAMLQHDFKGFFYQTLTELGYYKANIDHLLDLLKEVKSSSTQDFYFKDINTSYNASNMKKLKTWLENQANDIIYIYGGHDPWVSCSITPSRATNSVRYTMPSMAHNVRIMHLELHHRKLINRYINNRLGTNIQ